MFDFLTPIADFEAGYHNDPHAYADGGPHIAEHADKPTSPFAQAGQQLGDFSRGFHQEGLMGLLDPAGMMDRQAAQRELGSKFDIVPEGFVGPRLPNQLTEKEFEEQARTFSDIRTGRSDIKFDGSTDQKYRDGAMNDMANMMQTVSGRQLLGTMANNTAGEKDAAGNALHHSTTLMPYLKPDGTPDTSNSDESGVGATGHNDENGNGVNTRVRYNPGLNVGAGPEAWWPGRSDVILTHEMTHAYYDTQGKTDNSKIDSATGDGVAGNVGDTKLHRYEHQAAGLGRYADAPISENKYRGERALMGAANAPGSLPSDAGIVHRDYY